MTDSLASAHHPSSQKSSVRELENDGLETNLTQKIEPPSENRAEVSKLLAMQKFAKEVKPAKGVVVIVCNDPAIEAILITSVADGILTRHAIADMQVHPVSKIIALHATGARDIEAVMSCASKEMKIGKFLPKAVDYCTRFNPTSPEGVHIMVSNMAEGNCILAKVEFRDLERDAVISALGRLNVEAEKRNALIVIVVSYAKKQDVSWIGLHCGTFVQCTKCEPTPDAHAAIVLTNVTLANWHLKGIGRVMIDAFFSTGGDSAYYSSPFIAERALIRLAWNLSYEGVTFANIAKIIGLSTSNVSRNLAALPIAPKNKVGLAPPKNWHKRCADHYDLSEFGSSGSASGSVHVNRSKPMVPKQTAFGDEDVTEGANLRPPFSDIGLVSHNDEL